MRKRIAGVAVATALCVLMAAFTLFVAEQWRVERANQANLRRTVANAAAIDASRHLAAGRPHLARGSVFSIGSVFDGQLYYVEGAAPPAVDSNAVSAPVRVDGRTEGWIVAATKARPLTAFLPRYVAVGGALFFLAAGLALFMGRSLSTRLSRPLEVLASAMAEATSASGFSRRTQLTGGERRASAAEIVHLDGCFDHLLTHLRATITDLVAARDAAEQANRLKSQFLANMSHEIRTPLNGVMAMAEVLELDGGVSATQRERLAVIRRSGGHLLAILNDVLDMARMEAGALPLDQAPLRVADVLEGACAPFCDLARSKGVALHWAEAPGLAPGALGDARRLTQALSNLVANAVKFTESGSVQVRALRDEAGALRLVVADTGPGMSPELQARAFDKFVQGDATFTRRHGGAGLGLALARELAQGMGGRIVLDSVEGQGSVFSLAVPCPPAALPEPEPATLEAPVEAAAEDAEPQSLRVLAAEDNPANRQVLAAVLDAWGMDGTFVENGAEAVEAFRLGRFDLVLMDIQMPVMDGVAATEAMRALERETGQPVTPIIAVSANVLPSQVDDYLRKGFSGHVPKPIQLSQLSAAIEQAFVTPLPAPALAAAA